MAILLLACSLQLSASAGAGRVSGKVLDPRGAPVVGGQLRMLNSEESGKEAKTVTGCLQKGDEPGEFSIRGEDGMVWELKSNTVKLEEHVGHKVSVTGSAKEESKAEEKREKREGEVEKASSKEEYGDIRVTSLKMISDSCK